MGSTLRRGEQRDDDRMREAHYEFSVRLEQDATRLKRIAMTVEVALRAREKRDDRIAAKERKLRRR
jgi:hypothetical protein